MRQLGVGLIVVAALTTLLGVSGYVAGLPNKLWVENPKWMLLSREQQDAERQKALGKLHSWRPRFGLLAVVSAVVLVLGVLLVRLS